jgi:hypothetical protein
MGSFENPIWEYLLFMADAPEWGSMNIPIMSLRGYVCWLEHFTNDNMLGQGFEGVVFERASC